MSLTAQELRLDGYAVGECTHRGGCWFCVHVRDNEGRALRCAHPEVAGLPGIHIVRRAGAACGPRAKLWESRFERPGGGHVGT